MKFALTLLALLSSVQFSSPTLAHAGSCTEAQRTVIGEPAKNLIQALMFAGMMQDGAGFGTSPLADGSKTFHMDFISCDDTRLFKDGIIRYECRNPNEIEDATAKILADAISGLGVATDSRSGHTQYNLTKLACTVTVNPSGPEYQCTATALWTNDCR